MRISVVTLATSDEARACAFYASLLGCEGRRDRSGVTYFSLDGTSIAVFPRDALSRYCGVDAHGEGFEGITLSVNVDSAAAVHEATERARAAGATVVRAPGPAGWGGHVAWIADPDGHLWELVHNPRAR